jgi:chaperonin GroEL
MAHKELKYAEDARKALEGGVDAVANAVKVTLGPRGCYVVLDKRYGAPTITEADLFVRHRADRAQHA